MLTLRIETKKVNNTSKVDIYRKTMNVLSQERDVKLTNEIKTIDNLRRFINIRAKHLDNEIENNSELSRVEKSILKETLSHELEYLKKLNISLIDKTLVEKEYGDLIHDYLKISQQSYEHMIKAEKKKFDYYMRKISWFKIVMINIYDIYLELLTKIDKESHFRDIYKMSRKQSPYNNLLSGGGKFGTNNIRTAYA